MYSIVPLFLSVCSSLILSLVSSIISSVCSLITRDADFLFVNSPLFSHLCLSLLPSTHVSSSASFICLCPSTFLSSHSISHLPHSSSLCSHFSSSLFLTAAGPGLVRCLLFLKLDAPPEQGEEEKEKQIKQKQKKQKGGKPQQQNKAKGGKHAVDKEIEKELEEVVEEGNALFDAERRRFCHQEMLQNVFLTYFRIIKQAQDSPLLPLVLEGLAK